MPGKISNSKHQKWCRKKTKKYTLLDGANKSSDLDNATKRVEKNNGILFFTNQRGHEVSSDGYINIMVDVEDGKVRQGFVREIRPLYMRNGAFGPVVSREARLNVGFKKCFTAINLATDINTASAVLEKYLRRLFFACRSAWWYQQFADWMRYMLLRKQYMQACKNFSIISSQEECQSGIENFNAILEKNINNIGAWNALCFLYQLSQNYAKAKECCEKILMIDAQFGLLSDEEKSSFLNYKADLCDYMQDYASAADCYDKILQIDANNSNVLYQKARMLIQSGKYNIALEAIAHDVELLHEIADLLFEQQKYREAKTFYLQALNLVPSFDGVVAKIIKINKILKKNKINDETESNKLNKSNEATELNKLNKSNPNVQVDQIIVKNKTPHQPKQNNVVINNVNSCIVDNVYSKRSDSKHIYDRAVLLFNKHKYGKALRYFTQIIPILNEQQKIEKKTKIENKNILQRFNVYFYLSQIFFIQKEYEMALQFLEKAWDVMRDIRNDANKMKKNNCSSLWAQYCYWYAKYSEHLINSSSDRENIIRHYEEVLKIDPTYRDTLSGIEEQYAKLNQHATVITYYEKAYKSKCNDIQFLYKLAELYFIAARYEQALNIFNDIDKVLQLKKCATSDVGQMLRNKGDMLFAKQEYSFAVKYYAMAEKYLPQDLLLLHAVIEALLSLNLQQQILVGLEKYKKALENKVKHSNDYVNNRSWLYKYQELLIIIEKNAPSLGKDILQYSNWSNKMMVKASDVENKELMKNEKIEDKYCFEEKIKIKKNTTISCDKKNKKSKKSKKHNVQRNLQLQVIPANKSEAVERKVIIDSRNLAEIIETTARNFIIKSYENNAAQRIYFLEMALRYFILTLDMSSMFSLVFVQHDAHLSLPIPQEEEFLIYQDNNEWMVTYLLFEKKDVKQENNVSKIAKINTKIEKKVIIQKNVKTQESICGAIKKIIRQPIAKIVSGTKDQQTLNEILINLQQISLQIAVEDNYFARLLIARELLPLLTQYTTCKKTRLNNQINEIIAIDKAKLSLYFTIGLLYIELTQYADALIWFEKAQKFAPQNLTLLLAKVFPLLSLGKSDDAVTIILHIMNEVKLRMKEGNINDKLCCVSYDDVLLRNLRAHLPQFFIKAVDYFAFQWQLYQGIYYVLSQQYECAKKHLLSAENLYEKHMKNIVKFGASFFKKVMPNISNSTVMPDGLNIENEIVRNYVMQPGILECEKNMRLLRCYSAVYKLQEIIGIYTRDISSVIDFKDKEQDKQWLLLYNKCQEMHNKACEISGFFNEPSSAKIGKKLALICRGFSAYTLAQMMLFKINSETNETNETNETDMQIVGAVNVEISEVKTQKEQQLIKHRETKQQIIKEKLKEAMVAYTAALNISIVDEEVIPFVSLIQPIMSMLSYFFPQVDLNMQGKNVIYDCSAKLADAMHRELVIIAQTKIITNPKVRFNLNKFIYYNLGLIKHQLGECNSAIKEFVNGYKFSSKKIWHYILGQRDNVFDVMPLLFAAVNATNDITMVWLLLQKLGEAAGALDMAHKQLRQRNLHNGANKQCSAEVNGEKSVVNIGKSIPAIAISTNCFFQCQPEQVSGLKDVFNFIYKYLCQCYADFQVMWQQFQLFKVEDAESKKIKIQIKKALQEFNKTLQMLGVGGLNISAQKISGMNGGDQGDGEKPEFKI